jgi:single-strand DNA-binding protein
MAGSVNKVILIGNLGKDPEIRRLNTNVVVASFPIATSEVYTDKSTGEKRENTDWHNIVVWRGLAEVCEKYVKKGMKIYVEGKLKNRSWTDKEGIIRYTTEVFAEEITILSRLEGEKEKIEKKEIYPTQGIPNPPSSMKDMQEEEDDDLPF